jgi:photosystem II stability/assembly factor-like uncharacterized protein
MDTPTLHAASGCRRRLLSRLLSRVPSRLLRRRLLLLSLSLLFSLSLLLSLWLAFSPAASPLHAQSQDQSAQRYEWVPVAIPPAEDGLGDYWLEIFFLPSNPRYGWMVGFSGHTLRTTDSGRTWERGYVPLKVRVGNQIGHLEGIAFGDTLTGYCSGPLGLFKSVDGGRTWADIRDSAMAASNVWGVFCSHPDSVFACGASPRGDSLRFYRSTNGGRTWTYFSVTSPNSSIALDMRLFSTAPNGLGYASSNGEVWRTLDGARTWQPFSTLTTTSTITTTNSSVTTPRNPWLEDIQVVNNTILLPFDGNTGAFFNGVRESYAGALFSPDNGRTWREHVTNKQMYGAWLHDERRGWAVGVGGAVVYTDDAGLTWRDRNCGITLDADLDDVWFHNDRFGYIIGGTQFVGVAGSKSRIYRFTPDATPPSRITPTRTRICRGDTVRLVAPAESQTYLWSNGETSETIVVATTGTYSVLTCAGRSDTVTITVEDPPAVGIGPSANEFNKLCDVSRVSTVDLGVSLFVQRPLPGHRYFWRFAGIDSTASSASNTSNLPMTTNPADTSSAAIVSEGLTFRATRTGFYALVAVSPLGCASVTFASVRLNTPPNVDITASRPLRFCDGDSTTLAAPLGFRSYRWFRQTLATTSTTGSTGAGANSGERILVGTQPTFSTKTTGRYFVVVDDGNGCLWTSNTLDALGLGLRRQLFLNARLASGVLLFDTTSVARTTCLDLRLVNVDSAVTVTIQRPFMARNTEFSVPPAQFPFVLPPRSERVLQICFEPNATGIRRDTLTVTDSCATIPIPLAGVGIADTVEALSRCNVVVRAIRVSGERSFGSLLAVSQPAPNPASGEIVVATESVAPSAFAAAPLTGSASLASALHCTLYSALGVAMAEGRYTALARHSYSGSSTEKVREDGEFRINAGSVPNGVYLIVVRGADGTMVTLQALVRH